MRQYFEEKKRVPRRYLDLGRLLCRRTAKRTRNLELIKAFAAVRRLSSKLGHNSPTVHAIPASRRFGNESSRSILCGSRPKLRGLLLKCTSIIAAFLMSPPEQSRWRGGNARIFTNVTFARGFCACLSGNQSPGRLKILNRLKTLHKSLARWKSEAMPPFFRPTRARLCFSAWLPA